MKIKIPNFKEINITDYNYFVIGDKIYLLNASNNQFEVSKKGEKVLLATKYHIELFKVKIEQIKTATGIIVKPLRKNINA